MEIKLDISKAIYIVRSSVMDGNRESSIGNSGDYLTNDPTGGLKGVFDYDQDNGDDEEPEFDGQESYDEHLIDIHVSVADGKIQQDKFGNNWYLDGDIWYVADNDGELNTDKLADSPDDLDELEEKPYSAYGQWRETVHESWISNPDYKTIIERCNKYSTRFALEGTQNLINSRDWTRQNPDVHVDLTPRVLGSGIELIRLTDAISRGLARFISHGNVPVLEVRFYHGNSSGWRDVHAFKPEYTKYHNVSAANLPYDPDSSIPVTPNIDNWFIGYNSKTKNVQWTLSPLGPTS